MVTPSKENILAALEAVTDPEIPVVNVVELGIVREVFIEQEKIIVQITPTYSGCPAMDVITDEIKSALEKKFNKEILVSKVLSPPWSSSWISNEAKEKLRTYGIAPPTGEQALVNLPRKRRDVACPRCGSKQTEVVSEFGSTACKALYVCNSCKEPFDFFKDI